MIQTLWIPGPLPNLNELLDGEGAVLAWEKGFHQAKHLQPHQAGLDQPGRHLRQGGPTVSGSRSDPLHRHLARRIPPVGPRQSAKPAGGRSFWTGS